MTRFLDGPAGGTTLYLRRAPIYLRVTVCGEIVDALDQPGDRPEPSEGLYAYRLVGDVCSVRCAARAGIQAAAERSAAAERDRARHIVRLEGGAER